MQPEGRCRFQAKGSIAASSLGRSKEVQIVAWKLRLHRFTRISSILGPRCLTILELTEASWSLLVLPGHMFDAWMGWRIANIITLYYFLVVGSRPSDALGSRQNGPRNCCRQLLAVGYNYTLPKILQHRFLGKDGIQASSLSRSTAQSHCHLLCLCCGLITTTLWQI